MRHDEKLRRFDTIMRTHGGFLKGLLWKLTGNRETFADAWQEAMLAIWQHAAETGGPGAGGYLYRIALTAASRSWRKRGTASAIGDDSPVPAPGRSPEETAADREMADIVRRAIGDLAHQQGQALVMRYLEEKDYGELASALGCSEVAARSHVSKALATLRQKLSGIFDKETTRGR